MKLNRKLQHDILVALSKVYPNSLLVSELPGFADSREFMGNLFYLQEHGIIAGGDIREPGRCRSMVDAQITKTGLDFLADDGGLRAILGARTVKFDADELLEAVAESLKHGGISGEVRAAVQVRLEALETSAWRKPILQVIKGSAFTGPEQLEALLGGKVQE